MNTHYEYAPRELTHFNSYYSTSWIFHRPVVCEIGYLSIQIAFLIGIILGYSVQPYRL